MKQEAGTEAAHHIGSFSTPSWLVMTLPSRTNYDKPGDADLGPKAVKVEYGLPTFSLGGQSARQNQARPGISLRVALLC